MHVASLPCKDKDLRRVFTHNEVIARKLVDFVVFLGSMGTLGDFELLEKKL